MQLLRLQGGENLIQQEARSIIERQVGQLTHLVDDLLEVARITSGKIRLQPDTLDMRGVVERAVESARPLIDRRRHGLTVDAARRAGLAGRRPGPAGAGGGEPAEQRRQVHRRGGPDLARRPGATGDEMVLSVRDTGIGIDLGTLPRRLRPVHAGGSVAGPLAGRAGHRAVPGAAARGDARGTVEVRSDGAGLGSEFTVRLPLLLSPAPRRHRGTPERPRRPAHAGRVLVVDDNVDSAEILASC